MGLRGVMAALGKIFDVALKIVILGVVVVVLMLLFKMKEERLKSSQDVCEAQSKSWETKLRSCQDTCEAHSKSLESSVQVYKDSADTQARAFEAKLQSSKESHEAQLSTFTMKNQQLSSQSKNLEEQLKEKDTQVGLLKKKIEEEQSRYTQLTIKVRAIADLISSDSDFAHFQELNKLINESIPGYSANIAVESLSMENNAPRGSLERQIKFYEVQVKKEKEKIKMLEKQLLDVKSSYQKTQ